MFLEELSDAIVAGYPVLEPENVVSLVLENKIVDFQASFPEVLSDLARLWFRYSGVMSPLYDH